MCQTRKAIQEKAPKRPYRNFAEFCVRHTYATSRLKPGVPFYPCLHCHGRGWEYDPDDPPCPIEGNKMRDTIRCDTCGGSGESNRKTCFAKYREAINRWEVETILFKTNVKRRKRALAKLTADEIKALKELGI